MANNLNLTVDISTIGTAYDVFIPLYSHDKSFTVQVIAESITGTVDGEVSFGGSPDFQSYSSTGYWDDYAGSPWTVLDNDSHSWFSDFFPCEWARIRITKNGMTGGDISIKIDLGGNYDEEELNEKAQVRNVA